MNGLVTALKDLRRRKVFRGCGFYLLGAWSLVQIADVLAEPVGLPGWTVDALLIVALAGFPLAVWVAWRYELTEGGLARTRPITVDDADAIPLTLGVVDYLVIAGLAVLAGWLAYSGVDARRLSAEAELAEQAAPPAAAGIPERPPMDAPPNSIAVLPFDYLSDDDTGAFLADGVSDTVLHVLSRLPDLQVTARTSSFAYRDRALTAAQIAAALGVAHILEGTVQRVGEQVRVIARVVDARDDSELWSGRFDRGISAIFAIQDEIASNVAAALSASMADEVGAIAASEYEPELDAFEQYILGRRELERGTTEGIEAAVGHMERAIELDPRYALAYLGLRDALGARAGARPGTYPEIRPRLRELADQALELDPRLAEAWLARGSDFMEAKRFEDAREALDRAMALNPNLPAAWAALWNFRIFEGDREGQLEAIRRAVSLDPESDRHQSRLAMTLWSLARAEEAMGIARDLLRDHPEDPGHYLRLGRWHTQLGDPGRGMHFMQAALALDPDNLRHRKLVCEQHTHYLDLDGAEACFEALLEANPGDLDSRKWLVGNILALKGDREARLREAVRIGEQEIERTPRQWYPRAQVAEFLLALDEHERVLEVLGPAFPQLAGPDPQITDFTQWPARLMGEALWNLGDREAADRLLLPVLERIERSRKLQAGGWIAGVEDAQIHCIREQIAPCLSAFERAVDAGWLFYTLIAFKGSAFEIVEDRPRFEAALAALRAHAAEERAWYEAHRDDPVLPGLVRPPPVVAAAE